jgi:glycosyltransferase involved in cell wall biosynthesis
VGGSPNPSNYETSIKKTIDKRIIFPGYIYGDDVITLMRNSYAYIQPSDVEGLSPVILTVLGLGVPLICSDIKENVFIVKDEATIFKKSDINDLIEKLNFSLENSDKIKNLAIKTQKRIKEDFSWEKVTDEHLKLFSS